MVGFHLPRDPYYPNHGNGGWIEEDPKEVFEEEPEEDSKEDPEEDIDEGMDKDSEEEHKVYNPPPVPVPKQ